MYSNTYTLTRRAECLSDTQSTSLCLQDAQTRAQSLHFQGREIDHTEFGADLNALLLTYKINTRAAA